jgi:hypothetical protein
MFGISKRIFRKTIEDVVEIVGIHHENVNTLQGVVEHLASAVQDSTELAEVQNARIELLEETVNELIKSK